MWKSQSRQLLEGILGSRVALGWSRVMGRLADVKAPHALLQPAISLYSAAMGVDKNTYVEPEGGFTSFNNFFGRHLKEGERKICKDENALVSPCDGRLLVFGNMEDTGCELTIKRSRYTPASLLGNDADAALFKDGSYAVIYLHPKDYHRVHAPCSARLVKTRHIPGTRFPVTGWCEAFVDNIYDKNERMVFLFDLPDGEKIALVMVAALGVGNIESPFDPGVDKRQRVVRERCFDPSVQTAAGDEIGAFLLGSTVVLIGSSGAYLLDAGLETGPTKLGVRIGGMRAFGKAKP